MKERRLKSKDGINLERRTGRKGVVMESEENGVSFKGRLKEIVGLYDCVPSSLVIHQAGVTCPGRRPIRTFLSVRGSWTVHSPPPTIAQLFSSPLPPPPPELPT